MKHHCADNRFVPDAKIKHDYTCSEATDLSDSWCTELHHVVVIVPADYSLLNIVVQHWTGCNVHYTRSGFPRVLRIELTVVSSRGEIHIQPNIVTITNNIDTVVPKTSHIRRLSILMQWMCWLLDSWQLDALS